MTARFSWARHRFFDRLATLLLYELCVERDIATVTSVRQSPKPKWRPVLPLTLTLPLPLPLTLTLTLTQSLTLRTLIALRRAAASARL